MASGLVCGVGYAHATLRTGGGGECNGSGQGWPTYNINSEATMTYGYGTDPT